MKIARSQKIAVEVYGSAADGYRFKMANSPAFDTPQEFAAREAIIEGKGDTLPVILRQIAAQLERA